MAAIAWATLAATVFTLTAACGPEAHPSEQRERAPADAMPLRPPSIDAAALVQVPTPLPSQDAAPPKPKCLTKTLEVGAKPLGYRATGEVCQGLRQGAWEFADLDGKRLRRGSYEDDLETGKWTFWFKSGAKRSEGNFKKGQRSGPWFRNHGNGQRSLAGSYDEGLRDGRWRRWHESGQLYEDRVYVAGRREGVHHKWNKEGLLQYTRLCQDDVCKIQCRAKREEVCPPLTLPSSP